MNESEVLISLLVDKELLCNKSRPNDLGHCTGRHGHASQRKPSETLGFLLETLLARYSLVRSPLQKRS